MCFTVEPAIYIAPDRPEREFTMLENDRHARAERRLMLGTPAAKKLEEAEADEAEKITHRIPEEFLGIGVRIEDDIAITEDGPVLIEGNHNWGVMIAQYPRMTPLGWTRLPGDIRHRMEGASRR